MGFKARKLFLLIAHHLWKLTRHDFALVASYLEVSLLNNIRVRWYIDLYMHIELFRTLHLACLKTNLMHKFFGNA